MVEGNVNGNEAVAFEDLVHSACRHVPEIDIVFSGRILRVCSGQESAIAAPIEVLGGNRESNLVKHTPGVHITDLHDPRAGQDR